MFTTGVDLSRTEIRNGERAEPGQGVGSGRIIGYGDGTIEYRQTGKLLPAFEVNIADVTDFSVQKVTGKTRRMARVRSSKC
jgi:hypothetical protein